MIFLILIILFLIFGLFSFLGFVNSKKKAKKEQSSSTRASQVNFITSRGIKLFAPGFTALSDTEIGRLKPGNTIVVGVETIPEADIDRARIRVNTDSWSPEDVTQNFEKRYNVFYRSYTVATGEGRLKIEAELHSKQDGWLGE